MERRNFIKNTGLFLSSFYASRFPVIAGPFAPGESGGYQIPLDKKLDPAWVKSLFDRGIPTTYSKAKNELQFIGMPVGGIQTGTLYLGGEGRLWLWDIFNDNREGVNPGEVILDKELFGAKKLISRHGLSYVYPAKDQHELDQGFAFKITIGDKTIIKRMQGSDWDDILFEATYPIARIQYIDKHLPIELSAEVYSPFIALDAKDSGLPATIYSFKIKNNSNSSVNIQIIGWLENKICINHATEDYERINRILKNGAVQSLLCSIQSKTHDPSLSTLADYGTMSLSSTGKQSFVKPVVDPQKDDALFDASNATEHHASIHQILVGAVIDTIVLKPGQESGSDFLYSWHLPNLAFKAIPDKGRYYNSWFKSSTEVNQYIRNNFKKLYSESKLWKETFYDSTLPHWFLERTFLNISCLATTTSHRMEDGRYYAWEGIGCCPGTCTHVWQYAQASGRIFPSMEKDTRERIDLGLSFQPDGSMWYRGEADKRPAVDGQAGTILRFYREHQMSADQTFLKKNWNKIKSTIQYLISLDKNEDGMEDTPVENTLDAMWDGEIAWIVGLCIAAVKAGQRMAEEINDLTFATICKEYVTKGSKNMDDKLFNGEYYIHRPDAEKGRARLGSYNTCHIDQVYGQSWAYQVGLGRILDKEKTRAALKSLWNYNFTPDVGPYIEEHTGGRPYALAGDGGLIMNTNPKSEAKPFGDNETWQLGYFHECMTGFEHQVAAHMMAEGMVDEALVITRMIHDRYHAAKRNPFNEIECSDHYARAMASYGTFITACGFEYHGPKGYIRFAPKLSPENFKAPFVTAQGWGTYQQEKQDTALKASYQVKYGSLRLKSLSFEADPKASHATLTVGGKSLPFHFSNVNGQASIHLNNEVTLIKSQVLKIKIS